MNNSRLKAFTLIEITIAMLIAAVVIGLGYYTLQLFTRLSLEHQQQKGERFQVELLQHLLQRDFDRAQAIYLEEDVLAMLDSSGTIYYTLSLEHILRQQYNIRTDTFDIKSVQTEGIFSGPRLPAPNLIDGLHLQLQQRGDKSTLVLRKEYTAQELMTLEDQSKSLN